MPGLQWTLPCLVFTLVRARDVSSKALEWLLGCGGHVSKGLRVGRSHGRGLFATEAIEAGRRLISLPQRCTLCDETLLTESLELQAVADYLRRNATAKALASNKLLLTTFFLQQMESPKGRFAQYLRSLPQSVHSTISEIPLFWDKQEKASLQGTSATIELPKMFRAIHQDFEILRAAVPHLAAKHQLVEFRVAFAFVASRSFTRSSDLATAAIYPWIDLLNHPTKIVDGLPFGNTRVEVHERAGDFEVFLTSQEAIKAGEEVTMSYGHLSNLELLLRYGFTIPEMHRTCLTKVRLELESRTLLLDRCQPVEVDQELSAGLVKALGRYGHSGRASVVTLRNDELDTLRALKRRTEL